VSNPTPDQSADQTGEKVADRTAEAPDEQDERAALVALVGDWTTVPDIAERVGVPLARVRQYLTDRDLLSLRVGIPAKFVSDDGPRPELKGTFTVLADGGMSDEQILRWLFTPDETLPVDGAPVDALVAGHKTEVRRRAQAMAF